MSTSALTRPSHAGQKFSKNIFFKGVQLYFKIYLFEQNFYQYVAFYLVRKWTYKNAEEKGRTFSRTSKNLKNGRNSNAV